MPQYIYTVQPPGSVEEEPFVITSDEDLQPASFVPGRDRWRIVRIVEMSSETRWIDSEEDVVVRQLVETDLAERTPDDAA